MNAGLKIAANGLLSMLAVCVAIFLPAGTFDYWQAWLMLAVYAVAAAVMIAYFRATDPALLERRSRGPLAEASPTQRRIVLGAIVCYFAVYMVAALDHRFGWSSTPAVVALVGDALIVTSFILFASVLHANAFAASNITVEAGQPVATTGPYAIVRHPMYSGVLVTIVGIALALGSYWAVLLVVPIAAIFTLRLLDEEQFLVENLPGYSDYETRVRWRLLPGVF